MVSKKGPGLSFSSPPPKHPFKFINSSKGKKVLVMDGYIFHFHSKFKATSYFKCSHRSKGCGAGVSLTNWNLENCSFDSYQIINSQHFNHLPDPGKILRKEAKTSKVVLEKAQVDLKSPQFLSSRHVCLFCFSTLPSNYLENITLETVVPYGHDNLAISLDNPTKNSQAFDLLCSLLNVKWRRNQEGRNFDQTIPLPLCLKCQNLYQEVFQLHVQIRELEVLIHKRIKVIRGLVERSPEENERVAIGQTQLALLGLDNFRKKVKDVNFNFGCDPDNEENDTPSASTSLSTTATTTTIATKVEPEVDIDTAAAAAPLVVPTPGSTATIFEDPIIKQEVSPGEDPLEDNYEPDWVNEDLHDNSDNDIQAPPRDDYIMTTSPPPPRTRSTRQAAQRAIEKVAATITSCSDDDQSPDSAGDSDGPQINSESDPDSDTDPEIKTKVKTPKSSRLSSLSISRPIRYRPNYLKASSKKTLTHPIKPYSCNLCSTILIGTQSLSLHYSTNHPEKPKFTCKFCSKHYSTFRDITTHQRSHTGEKPFKCPQCPFSTTGRRNLLRHISNKHTPNRPRKPLEIHPCPSTNPPCTKIFSSISILNNHLVSFHSIAPSTKTYKVSGKPIKIYTCHLCDTKISGQGPFAQHYIEFHPTHKKYTCKFCPAHFPYLREVLNHQRRRHTGERPFKCDHCQKSFTGEKALQHHLTSRHFQGPPEYPCPQCPKRYPTKSTLNAHISYHHQRTRIGDTATFCKTCGKAFRRADSFPSHNQKFHQGTAQVTPPITDYSSLENLETSLGINFDKEQRVNCHVCWKLIIPDKLYIQRHFDESHKDHKGTIFNCGKCGKKFGRFKNCTDHTRRRHRDEPKGYQCDKCEKSFYSGGELESHLLRHVPVEERKKKNICDVCGEGFTSVGRMYYHRKKHGEEGKDKVKWVCDECGKSYSEKRGLQHHQKVVHRGELKWGCGVCGKRFSERICWKRHERGHGGVKEFKCGFCEVAFVHPTSKTRHEREVHGVGGGEKGRKRKRKTGKRRGGKEGGM